MRGSLVATLDKIDISKIKETVPFYPFPVQKESLVYDVFYRFLLGKAIKAKGEVKLLNLAFSMSSTSPPVKNLTADISFDEMGVDIPYLYIHRGESILKVNTNVKNFSHAQATFRLSSPNFRKADFPPNAFIKRLVKNMLEKTSTIKGDIEIDQISLKSFNANFLKQISLSMMVNGRHPLLSSIREEAK